MTIMNITYYSCYCDITVYIYILHYITIVIEISGELPIIFRPGKEWHRIVTLGAVSGLSSRELSPGKDEDLQISPVSLEHLGISRHWSLHWPSGKLT